MSKKLPVAFPIYLSLAIVFGILIGYTLPGDQGKPSIIKSLQPNGSKIPAVIQYIKEDYVDTIDISPIEDKAIEGLLEYLDPHSSFISAQMFKDFNDPLLGSFEGVGIAFRIEDDTVMVLNPIAGGPSEKAGIQAGDRIVKVEDSLIAGVDVTTQTVMRLLKGEKGTEVHVSVHRRGISNLLEFEIIRDVIPTYSLDIAYMLQDQIGYMRLNKFSATTAEEFKEGIEGLLQQGLSKLILDLRGNSGGYLKAAIDIADEFLPKGDLIVYTEGKNRSRNYAFATKNGLLEDVEVVVLIDEGSASASEIVAGAIQDQDRGTIIGRRSFGKGLVQEQMNLPDGSAIRLTVARYYTPTGRSIQRPYKPGEKNEDYDHEFHKRYESGEVFSLDSVPLNDSLKYTTKGGKTVFGGGGIMPDIYVPLMVDSNLVFYNKVLRAGLVYRFAFNYADQNRIALLDFGSEQDFINDYQISADVMNKFIEEARSKGITATPQEIEGSKVTIKTLIKAYLGRLIHSEKTYYPIYHQIDTTLKTAVQHLG